MEPVLCVEFGDLFLKAAVVRPDGSVKRITDSTGAEDIPAYIYYENREDYALNKIWVTFGTDAVRKFIDNPKGGLVFPKVFLSVSPEDATRVKLAHHLPAWMYKDQADALRVLRDMFTEIKYRAEKEASTKIERLWLFLSSCPNDTTDKLFISAAKMADFTDVQILPLCTALPLALSEEISYHSDFVIVHLGSIMIEVTRFSSSGKQPIIHFNNSVPVGIVQFLQVVLNWLLEKVGENEFEQSLMEHLRWHSIQIVRTFLYTEETSYLVHIGKKIMRTNLARKVKDFSVRVHRNIIWDLWGSKFAHLFRDLESVLKQYSDDITNRIVRVIFSPGGLKYVLSNDSPMLEGYENAGHNENNFLKMCSGVTLPEMVGRKEKRKDDEIEYAVFFCTEDKNLPSSRMWTQAIMTESALFQPPVVAPKDNVVTFEEIHLPANQSARTRTIQLLSPNYVLSKSQVNEDNQTIYTVYEIDEPLHVQEVFSIGFQGNMGVLNFVPNPQSKLYLLQDGDGICLAKMDEQQTVINRRSGQFGRWFQWVSDTCVAYQKDRQILLLDIESLSESVIMELDSQTAALPSKTFFTMEAMNSYLLFASSSPNPTNTDGRRQYGRVYGTHNIPISMNDDLVACTVLSPESPFQLLALNRTAIVNEFLINCWSVEEEEDPNALFDDQCIWVNLFAVAEDDEPVSLSNLPEYGLVAVMTRKGVVFLFITSSGRLLYRSHDRTMVLLSGSGMVHNGQGQHLLAVSEDEKVFTVRVNMDEICQRALELDENHYALQISVTLGLPISQDTLMQALPDIMEQKDFDLLASVVDLIKEPNVIEIFRTLLQYYPNEAVCFLLRPPTNADNCEAMLELFVEFKFTPGIRSSLSVVCNDDITGRNLTDKVLQRCLTVASSFNLVDLYHKLLRHICSVNPKIIDMSYLDGLKDDHSLFTLSSRDDLYAHIVGALLSRNEYEYLISLINKSDKPVALLSPLISHGSQKEMEIMRRIIPRNDDNLNMDIAALLRSNERFEVLIEWLDKISRLQKIDEDFCASVAVSLIESETGRSFFPSFARSFPFFPLEQAIRAAASQPASLPCDLWHAIAQNCIDRNQIQMAVDIMQDFQTASLDFGELLLQQLQESAEKHTTAIPWPVVVDYFDTIPNVSLRKRSLAYLEKKAPEALAFAHSKRGSYADFQRLWKQSDRETAKGICSICFDATSDCAFIPCGHVTCCDCAQSLTTCPQCRQTIVSKHKIFLT